LVAKPNYDHTKIFDENLVAVHLKNTELIFNKPVYLGMCILDISKTLMYDFHYNYMKKKFNCNRLMTDTDSLMYEIKTEDFTKILKMTFWRNLLHQAFLKVIHLEFKEYTKKSLEFLKAK